MEEGQLKLDIKVNSLNGIEGLAYGPVAKRFRRAKKPPPPFSRYCPTAEQREQTDVHPDDFGGRGLKDISGLHYDASSGRLLILSHESACVVEANKYGIEKSRLSLKGGRSGLKQTVLKAEGVALDKQGTLYTSASRTSCSSSSRKASDTQSSRTAAQTGASSNSSSLSSALRFFTTSARDEINTPAPLMSRLSAGSTAVYPRN